MSSPLPPFCESETGLDRSARHSLPGRPAGCAEGATPPPLSGVAPPPLSNTLAERPTTDMRPVVPVAVLTCFDGQAVFRILGSREPALPRGMLFRLRKGQRLVRGGPQ